MDLEYQPIQCNELKQKILLVKLPDGSSRKFWFNKATMMFEPMDCSDCNPSQMDSDLTPRHTEWCPHTRTTLVFAYNHVLKMELKYRFDCESGSFHEIECDKCQRNPEKTTDPKQIVLVATSPKSKRAIVLAMNKEGRVQKMQYDEEAKKYVDMEPTGVKALIVRGVEKEPDLPKAMCNLSLKEVTRTECELIPLYMERSQCVPDTEVLIGKNMITGELGMYVFDRYIHQFLQVVLPDVKYKKGDPCSLTKLQKLIFLTMSSKDNQAISVQHDPKTGGLKKYHYNRETALFELMEEMLIIEKERDIEQWIDKILKTEDPKSQKITAVLEFLRKIQPFMVKQANGMNLADYCDSGPLDFSADDHEDYGIETSPSDTSTSSDTGDTSSDDTSSDEEEEEDEPGESSDTDSDSLSDDGSFDIIFEDEVVNCEKDKTD